MKKSSRSGGVKRGRGFAKLGPRRGTVKGNSAAGGGKIKKLKVYS